MPLRDDAVFAFLRYISVIGAIRSATPTISKADSATASHPAPSSVQPPRPIYVFWREK